MTMFSPLREEDLKGIGKETIKKILATRPSILYKDELTTSVGVYVWDFHRIGYDNYSIILSQSYRSDRGFVMDGTTQTFQFQIPFDHEWLRVNFRWVNSSYATSNEKKDLSLYTQNLQIPQVSRHREYLLELDEEMADNITKPFEAGRWVFAPSTYTIMINGQNTEIMLPMLFVKRLI